jgi:alpha-ketoglutarate-dependent taurine dioxygenase
MDKHPFDLDSHAAYQHWRDTKRACHPRRAEDLIVDVADPRALSQAERDRLLALCATANMAIYRSPVVAEDKAIPRLLAARMGLHRLDGNWLADDDGISPIAVAAQPSERPAFIPYTNRPIKWHTDGYYHPQTRQIRAMVLHCVRRAQTGGESAVMDHEMAYIALREANPDWVRALMATRRHDHPRSEPTKTAWPAPSRPARFSRWTRPAVRCTCATPPARAACVWKDDAPTRCGSRRSWNRCWPVTTAPCFA